VVSDVTLAERLRERIDHDISRVRDATAHADRVAEATAVVVQRGLSLNETRINVVQGSLIGAILMVLAAIQALEPDVKGVPGAIQLPLIVALGALALALPTALFRLSRSAPRDLPLKIFDQVTMAASVGGVAWLTGQLVTHLTGHRFLGVAGVLGCVAGGLVVLAAAGWALSARKR
jgi:hypothetical protein